MSKMGPFARTFKSKFNGTYSECGMSFYTFKRMKETSSTAKILLYTYANPDSTRREIQDLVYGKMENMYSSFGGSVWRFLLSRDLIHKYRDNINGNIWRYQITSKGIDIIHKIIENTYKK